MPSTQRAPVSLYLSPEKLVSLFPLCFFPSYFPSSLLYQKISVCRHDGIKIHAAFSVAFRVVHANKYFLYFSPPMYRLYIEEGSVKYSVAIYYYYYYYYYRTMNNN